MLITIIKAATSVSITWSITWLVMSSFGLLSESDSCGIRFIFPASVLATQTTVFAITTSPRCLNWYSCFLIFFPIIRFLIALWRYWPVSTRILCWGKGCYDLHLKWLQRNTLYYYQKTVPFPKKWQQYLTSLQATFQHISNMGLAGIENIDKISSRGHKILRFGQTT